MMMTNTCYVFMIRSSWVSFQCSLVGHFSLLADTSPDVYEPP